MTKKNPLNPINGATQHPKKYFWLVSGEVYFSRSEQPDLVTNANMNSILTTIAPAVNSVALGNAQASLTQTLKDSDPSVDFRVHNVLFHGISALGHMTDEDFFGKPSEPVMQ